MLHFLYLNTSDFKRKWGCYIIQVFHLASLLKVPLAGLPHGGHFNRWAKPLNNELQTPSMSQVVVRWAFGKDIGIVLRRKLPEVTVSTCIVSQQSCNRWDKSIWCLCVRVKYWRIYLPYSSLIVSMAPSNQESWLWWLPMAWFGSLPRVGCRSKLSR